MREKLLTELSRLRDILAGQIGSIEATIQTADAFQALRVGDFELTCMALDNLRQRLEKFGTSEETQAALVRLIIGTCITSLRQRLTACMGSATAEELIAEVQAAYISGQDEVLREAFDQLITPLSRADMPGTGPCIRAWNMLQLTAACS